MLHAFDGRARSDAGASHVFPQSVLSAITLVRLESEDRVGLGCEAKLPLCSLAIASVKGWVCPLVGVVPMRVSLNQTPSLLSGFPVLRKGSAERSDVHSLTEV